MNRSIPKRMKTAALVVALALLSRPVEAPKLPVRDAVRLREFHRLDAQIEDRVWPGWSRTPAPLLLVSGDIEFLSGFADPPEGFAAAGDGLYTRPRQFPRNLQATFPAFGPPSVIAVGTAENTASRDSTSWVLMLMHEHFHQLQDAQPGSFERVAQLGLSRGDTTGMWMLNFPFPYGQPRVASGFARLRDLLLASLEEGDESRARELAERYRRMRREFLAGLTPDERKYLGFQLWKEGIARYTEVKVAEAAGDYEPTPEFRELPDFESFASRARDARKSTLEELAHIDLEKAQRTTVYSFGAAEGFFLDRFRPRWTRGYFEQPLSLDAFFE